MLEQIQIAHYVKGKRISEPSVLTQLARAIGLDMIYFAHSLRIAVSGPVQVHIRSSLQLIAETAALGFPSCVLESNGQKTLLNIGQFMGKPEHFSEWLQQMVARIEIQHGQSTAPKSSIVKTQETRPIA